jgi:hypothetical protein
MDFLLKIKRLLKSSYDPFRKYGFVLVFVLAIRKTNTVVRGLLTTRLVSFTLGSRTDYHFYLESLFSKY